MSETKETKAAGADDAGAVPVPAAAEGTGTVTFIDMKTEEETLEGEQVLEHAAKMRQQLELNKQLREQYAGLDDLIKSRNEEEYHYLIFGTAAGRHTDDTIERITSKKQAEKKKRSTGNGAADDAETAQERPAKRARKATGKRKTKGKKKSSGAADDDDGGTGADPSDSINY